MNIRPLQGQVLLRMDARESESAGGIALPSKAQDASKTGTVVRAGIWKMDKAGRLIPFPVKRGDKVVVSRYRGRWIKGEGYRLKLVAMEDILAILN